MESQQSKVEVKPHQNKGPAVVVEFGEQKEGTPDRDALSGQQIPVGAKGELTFDAAYWQKYIEDEVKDAKDRGDFEKAARLQGKAYNPDFGESVVHTLVKMKSATITVLLAAVTPLFMIVIWEGMRLAIPRTRSWPGFIKYKPALEDVSKRVVRLSAR